MNIKFVAYLIIAIILIGITVYSATSNIEKPMFINLIPREKPSPYDWVKENQIQVYNDRVIIYIQNPEWATFTDTNSMDPLIDVGANAIQVIPKGEEDIHIGDIISYKQNNSDSIIIHRVVEINKDSEGTYYIAKGDNNTEPDPEKVRFNQIKRVLVAVIY